jgi:ribosomal protein S21
MAMRLRGLVQSIRRWKRRRTYHQRIRRNKRAKSRARSRTATDLRMGQHERP